MEYYHQFATVYKAKDTRSDNKIVAVKKVYTLCIVIYFVQPKLNVLYYF